MKYKFVRIAELLDEKQIAATQKMAISNMLEIEAFIELLDEKGIIPKDELMKKCKKMGGRFARGRCLFHSEFVSFGVALTVLIEPYYIKLHHCFIFFGNHRRKLNWTSSQMISRSSNQQLVVAS